MVKQSFAADAFFGDGPKLLGGRWNSKGTAVVYAAEHLATAVLEAFVNLSQKDKGEVFYAYPLDIPSEVRVVALSLSSLPADWRAPRQPCSTKKIGDAWVLAGESAILCVPSVLVPQENNFILNPAHPDFFKIVIDPPEEFSFDSRMWK